jgi:hypothetical protein
MNAAPAKPAAPRAPVRYGDPTDIGFGSCGLDQCLDLVEKALASGGGNPTPAGDDWTEGTGIAMAMLDSGPPTEHRSGAQMTLLPDGRKPPRSLPWVSASITRAGIW